MKVSLAADLPLGLEVDILKSLHVPLAVIDTDFRFLWLNREMARIYQTRPKTARGRICYQLASGQTQPCPDCPVQAAQQSGRRQVSQKYKDFPGGVRKFGEMNAFPVISPENKYIATILMVVDITDKVVVNLNDMHRHLALWARGMHRTGGFDTSSGTQARGEYKAGKHQTPNFNLTRRETHVLQLLAKGQSNTEIASRLLISPHTVKSHVINIFNKLGVSDRVQAAVWAARHGMID